VGLLPYILIVMLPGILVTLWASNRVRTTYAKWDKVDSGIAMTAFDFARYLLNSQGLNEVGVEPTPGNLTDHYDPRTRTLRVSQGTAGSRAGGRFELFGSSQAEMAGGYPTMASGHLSVASVAVIAHEVGHAAQHQRRDPMMALRQAVVPVANIGSTLAPWLIIIGVFINMTGLAIVGLAFFAAAVAFTFVTLPVEFGASNRALAYVGPLGLTGERAKGAHDVLRAAGWTYVAAALTALLTFLYYLTLVSGSRR
jgi:Zn-dependent membrane protease YugP